MSETHLDISQFQKAFREHIPLVTGTLAEITNKKMFYIARGASRETPVSQNLEHDLGIVGYMARISRKTKKSKKGKAIYSIRTGLRFAAIINARRAKAGLAALARSEMGEAVRKLFAARLRSKGTERTGWLAGIRVFARSIGESSLALDRTSVTHKSIASTAKEGWSPVATLEYRIISTDTNKRQYIDDKTTAALQKAFDDEAQSMIDFAAKRLQKDADKINAR
jgi:hypothetical protein